ncbi:hypothetical protein [Hymenobacter sp. AT01-02]|nr:hypothetical protein [Hymenobacter sp. AT01-02]
MTQVDGSIANCRFVPLESPEVDAYLASIETDPEDIPHFVNDVLGEYIK